MYEFRIEKDKNKAWRFELNGIKMIVENYEMKDNKHWIINPLKAIAYFYIKGNIYGVGNKKPECSTVEDFFELMQSQYAIFQKTA